MWVAVCATSDTPHPVFKYGMTTSTPVQLLSPEEIATRQGGEAQHLKFADLGFVFRDRALRLRQLAAGHPMRDFLMFMAEVAEAQNAALTVHRDLHLPSEAFLGEAAHHGKPPLEFPQWQLSDEWQEDLQCLLAHLKPRVALPASHIMTGLESSDPTYLQQQAERLLRGVMFGLDLSSSSLIAAALQVHWTRLVHATQQAYPDLAFGPIDNPLVCPCCGSLPVSSVARIGPEEAGSRYLHCTLCQSEWHMVRIKCTHCESTKTIAYQELEPLNDTPQATYIAPKGAVRAECCDDCGHYLKQMDMAKDPHVDPVADDLATVALDLLVSDTGKQRHGVNLMLLWGEPADETSLSEAESP